MHLLLCKKMKINRILEAEMINNLDIMIVLKICNEINKLKASHDKN